MKVILVVDLPATLIHLLGKEVFLQISHRDGRYITTEKSMLKLLPPKKLIKNIIWADKFYDDFDKGYNACLEDITGETEWK